MEKKRNSSVFTKGQVQALLVNFGQEIAPCKSVKEVRERLAELVRIYTPQSRGRRKANIDFAVLQTVVEEARQRTAGNDAPTLACMVASLWNMQGENYTKCPIDTQRVRTYVEKGKLTFPDEVKFVPRRKREVKTVTEEIASETN